MIHSDELPPPAYEPHDASLRLIGIMALILPGLVAFTLVVSAWIYPRHDARSAANKVTSEKTFENGVDWQSSIARDWADQDRRTHENLTTYGWVDRRAGIVRIPIDRAMTLVTHESSP